MLLASRPGEPALAESNQAIAPEAARCTTRHVQVEDGVSLRVLQWQPKRGRDQAPLVFVAGWVSVVEGWRPLLEALVRQRPVIYIETREKRSARFPTRRLETEHLSIPRLADDIIEVCARLRVDRERAVLFGSSMGANAILEGLKHDRLRARAAFLIGPNSEFDFRWWGRLLLHLPASSYHLLKYAVLWYLRHFRIDVRKEPEQMQRYERTLRAAHPQRLKLSARAVADYEVWPALGTIEIPVAIAYASSDTLHGEEKIRRIVAAMPRGTAVRCPSNHHMHSAAITVELDGFLRSLE